MCMSGIYLSDDEDSDVLAQTQTDHAATALAVVLSESSPERWDAPS